MNQTLATHVIKACGRHWTVRIRRSVRREPSAPRLVIVGFQPNATAKRILALSVASIRRHTPEAHELWVVDNGSPAQYLRWMVARNDLNLVLNATNPQPPRRLWDRLRRRPSLYAGSYANAVALELAARAISPDADLMMSLHMDTMACRTGWLDYLRRHLDRHTRCVGVRMNRRPVTAVHVLGMLFDFSLYARLGLSFAHDMPRHDVGDGISLGLQRAGYGLWACRNTHIDPPLVETLPRTSPFRGLAVDRALDDDGAVVFVHLGRAIAQTRGHAHGRRVTPEQWLDFGRKVVLGGADAD